VFTHAGSSTVTMGHGSEGVMYNTLNGQLIEFLITAKELNGGKRTEGGDVFEVEISTQEGELVFNIPAVDCGNGTYSFCFTPVHGVTEYQLSVTLNGCHVMGSPFAWVNEIWNLYTQVHDDYGYSHGRFFSYIQLTEDNMKATMQQQFSQGQFETVIIYEGSQPPWSRQLEEGAFQEVNYSDSKWTVFGSSSFGSSQHSWKICITGNFTAGFAFGVGGIPQGQFHWTWSSGHRYQPSSKCQESAITNCMNNDVIEVYLDCDNQTLTMYNQRTRQLDTWRRIQGEVRPMFELCCIGDEVSLPC